MTNELYFRPRALSRGKVIVTHRVADEGEFVGDVSHPMEIVDARGRSFGG